MRRAAWSTALWSSRWAIHAEGLEGCSSRKVDTATLFKGRCWLRMVKYGELLVTDFFLLCFLVKAVLLMRERNVGES